MFNLKPEQQGSILTLHVSGDVVIDHVPEFNEQMRQYSKTPNIKQLVLDLSALEKMDTAGLGILLSLHTSMQRYGRRLVLARIPPLMQKLLVASEIEGFFPTVESEEELKDFVSEGMR